MLNDTFRTILTIRAEKTNEPQEIVAFVDAERNNNTNNFIETVLNHYFQPEQLKPLPKILVATLTELKQVLQKEYDEFLNTYSQKETLEKALQPSGKRKLEEESEESEVPTSPGLSTLFKKEPPPAPKKSRKIMREHH